MAGIPRCFNGRFHSKLVPNRVGSLVDEQRNLIRHNNNKDHTNAYQNYFDHPELAMKAQEDGTDGNDEELPDPKVVAMDCNDRVHNRVAFDAFGVQNHHREQGVYDIQADNEKHQEK
jgi:hypothetical protein